jgi:hypothetical protein
LQTRKKSDLANLACKERLLQAVQLVLPKVEMAAGEIAPVRRQSVTGNREQQFMEDPLGKRAS